MKLQYLRDAFAESVDLTRWSVSGPEVQWASSNTVRMPAGELAQLTSVRRYNAADSEIVVWLQDYSEGGDTQTWIRVSGSSGNYFQIAISVPIILCSVTKDFVDTASNALGTYDPETMQFLRIRERAGSVNFAVSPDFTPTSTWTTLLDTPHDIDVSSSDVTIGTIGGGDPPYGYGVGMYGSGRYGGAGYGTPPFYTYLYAVNPSLTQKGTGIPATLVTVPAPPAWEWLVDDLRVTSVQGKAKTLDLKLKDPSQAQFTVDGRSPEALGIVELVSDLYVRRNGEDCFRGRITRAQDSNDGRRPSCDVTADDYREILNRRDYVNESSPATAATYTAQRADVIAWDLISHTQDKPGGSLSIVQGSWPVAGTIPSFVVQPQDTIWESLSRLAATSPGFDIDVDMDLNANLYYPTRGNDNGIVLDFGGTVHAYTRTIDTSQYANVVYSAQNAVTTTVADIGTRAEGRWETGAQDASASGAGVAALYLAERGRLTPSYDFTLRRGAWEGPSHIWLGDVVGYVIRDGRLNDVGSGRVTEINISTDTKGRENVRIMVGAAPLSIRNLMKALARTVRKVSP